MFDPAKLSPLPVQSVYSSEGVLVWSLPSDDDAKFFAMSRRCYDIGERRGWYVQRGNNLWMPHYQRDYESLPDRFRTIGTIAEAMELMIEADEWLTNKEGNGAK